jgi:hypothetical protein
VDKGGWLDQLLLGVLGFLNQRWLGLVVTLGGGFLVAYLARRSPKQDWAYIKEGPGAVLTGAFLLLAALKSVPRLAVPKTSFTCDHAPGLLGIPEATNCRWISEGAVGMVYDYTLGDFAAEFFGGLLRDFVLGGLAYAAGFAVATAVTWRSGGRAAGG